MGASDRISRQEERIKHLEMELNDLHQGLVIVRDYYHDLGRVSENHEAAISFERGIVRPLIEDDREFTGIWRFHREIIIPDPSSHIPYAEMYDAFVRDLYKRRGNPPWIRKCLNLCLPEWRTPARCLTGANGRAAGS